MVRLLKRSFVSNARDFAHAFKNFNHNARTHLVSVFFQAAGTGMIATVFALYVQAARLGERTVGHIEGAFAIGVAVIALAGPLLIAAFGYRLPMAAALALVVGARFAQGATPLAMPLIALGLAVGLGDGLLRTVNSAYLSENSTHEVRSHLFSAEFLVRMIALFAGALAGGLLPALIDGPVVLGLRWTIDVGAAMMALGIVPMLLMREKVHGVKGFFRVQFETARTFEAWGHLGRLALPQALLAAGAGLVAPFVPLYLHHTLGASLGQVGLLQGAASLVAGLAAFGTPLLKRKIGGAKAAVALQTAAVPLLFTVPMIASFGPGIVAFLSRSTVMSIGAPLWSERAMAGLRAQDKPFLAGGLTFCLSMMGFVGNIVGGKLMETSYTAPYLPAALLWAAGTVVTWALWVRPAARPASSPIAIRASAELAEAA